MRAVHEAQMYERNCFLTLTYNDEHLPAGRQLRLDDVVRFNKRLRKWCRSELRADASESEVLRSRVKIMYCGEYGPKDNRPHYHLIVFNADFGDKKLWTIRNGHKLYVSETLSSLWSDKKGEPIGYSSIGNVTFESAAYVARYSMKKIKGKDGKDFTRVNFDEGSKKWYPVPGEFAHFSNGIGKTWFQKYSSDVFPDDFVVVRGNQKCGVPRYYDKLLEREDPLGFEQIKNRRRRVKRLPVVEATHTRLKAAEVIKKAQLSRLRRDL